MSELRTLTIRVTPLPGESMDSWLEALARRCWMPLPSLLSSLQMPPPERIHQLVTGLSEQHLRTLEEGLRLPAGRLDQSVAQADLFGRRAPRCRFCPQCLEETQGRWMLRWWLPWTFVCTRHQALLHPVCPRCKYPPRQTMPGEVHRQPPGQCLHKPTRQRLRCGTDLSAARPLPLAPHHHLLSTQEQLDALPVHGHAADSVFANVDRLLARPTTPLSPGDLAALDATSRRAWEQAFNDVTDPATPLGRWRLRERARMILTPEFLHREHEKSRKALREIAEDLRLPRRIVHERAKELGIKIQPGGVRPHQFDDDWLRDQYVVRLRSGSDISRETGTSGMPVLRRLTALGIPIRPAGAYSRRDMLAKLDESVPLDIRAAVEGTLHGWRRLNRFQIHMAFPNATATATYLNVKPNTLSMQFSQLERAIGAELFHRSTGHTPQRPTTQGAALLHHLTDEHIQVLMRQALGPSIMPMPKPEAIAAAQTSFGGKPAP
ncbi:MULTISPECIES: TniQ family protein [Streptomyces]|jgi:Bacterial regulatory helix-turn-helix protein, lysR family.|uniref:TniQ family protein n=1 Tax=Streptomyces mirabilis TaxID=68239 RepID=A0ABU3V794_9ACTN|nr:MULTISPECIES: TniQ family protein [Streptomyces]MCX4607727.1 TniQ family protein [Streptomyces mirabilis]MCX4617587.1 TniQ family protein [Streptomyces mirabilis]MCX5356317.1 TniQ family protein [Streptomyces mirabilis]MCX5356938.1 TniQ family protein [Streptomyces mirabilis]MDU8998450.1 TniQ family protein [Streptomyces mirabilis]